MKTMSKCSSLDGAQSLASIRDGKDVVAVSFQETRDHDTVGRLVLGNQHTKALAPFWRPGVGDEALGSPRRHLACHRRTRGFFVRAQGGGEVECASLA